MSKFNIVISTRTHRARQDPIQPDLILVEYKRKTAEPDDFTLPLEIIEHILQFVACSSNSDVKHTIKIAMINTYFCGRIFGRIFGAHLSACKKALNITTPVEMMHLLGSYIGILKCRCNKCRLLELFKSIPNQCYICKHTFDDYDAARKWGLRKYELLTCTRYVCFNCNIHDIAFNIRHFCGRCYSTVLMWFEIPSYAAEGVDQNEIKSLVDLGIEMFAGALGEYIYGCNQCMTSVTGRVPDEMYGTTPNTTMRKYYMQYAIMRANIERMIANLPNKKI